MEIVIVNLRFCYLTRRGHAAAVAKAAYVIVTRAGLKGVNSNAVLRIVLPSGQVMLPAGRAVPLITPVLGCETTSREYWT